VIDATGTAVRGTRQRTAHSIRTGPDGEAILGPELVFGNVVAAIDAALASLGSPKQIEGVAMDTFASSLIGLDAEGTALTPCLTYADSRAAAQVQDLRREYDETAVQQRTGCRFSSSYLTAQIRWLNEAQPVVSGRVARWVSLGEYIYGRLLQQYAVSFSTAAWTGLLNRHTGDWDNEMLAAAGVRIEQLSPVRDTRGPLDGAGSFAARRWPALARARWFPAVADGFASNVGSGATDSRTAALAAGTSGAMRVLVDGVPERVPPGLWCYRVDARRSLLGGALNDVGRLAAWLRDRLRLPDDATLDAALRATPEPVTPIVLPFLTGERSTGWASNATAAFLHVTAATTASGLWRGAMEGLALRYAGIAEQLTEVAPRTERVIASGGVVEATPGWLQIVADALGRSVARSDQRYATLLGTALIALDVLAPNVSRRAPEEGDMFAPVPEHAEYYRIARREQDGAYSKLVAAPEREHAVLEP
jgi:gluconokinase